MKRFLALILAAAMILALVPAVSLADDGEGSGTWSFTAVKKFVAVKGTIAKTDFTATYTEDGKTYPATVTAPASTTAPDAGGWFDVDVTATCTTEGTDPKVYSKTQKVSLYASAAFPCLVVSPAETHYSMGAVITPLQSFYTAYYIAAAGGEAYDVTTSTLINRKASYTCNRPGPISLTIRYTHKDTGVRYEQVMKISVAATVNTLAVSLSPAGEAKAAFDADGVATGWAVGDVLSREYFIVEYTKAGSEAPVVLTEASYAMTPAKLGAGESQNITFTYESTSCVFTIAPVKAPTEPKLIMEGSPVTSYSVGDDFDTDAYTLFYQEATTGTQHALTPGASTDPSDYKYVVAPANFTSAGAQNVLLSYTDANGKTLTMTVKVTVTAKLGSMVLDGTFKDALDQPRTFYVGNDFDPTGLTAKILKPNGALYKTHTFTGSSDNSDFSYSVGKLTAAGTQRVTITYRDKETGETVSAGVDVVVTANVKKLVYSGTIPTFYVGEAFKPFGITFQVEYYNGTTGAPIVGTTDLAYSGKGLTWPTQALVKTDKAVRVTYTDPDTKETAYVDVPVTVADPTAAKLEVSLKQANLQTVVGDTIDPDKLFTVLYKAANTGTVKTLSYAAGEYTLSPATDVFATAGVQTFTFTKDTLTATATVTVLPVVKSMSVVANSARKQIYAGSAFTLEGLTITVVYNHGSLWEYDSASKTYKERPGITAASDGADPTRLMDGSTENPYAGVTFPSDNLVAGWQSIALTYRDLANNGSKTTEFFFTVNKKLSQLTVEPVSSKTFDAGEYFDPTDKVTATLELTDGTKETVAASKLYFDQMLMEAGNRSIVLEYTDEASGETVSCTFTFVVSPVSYTEVKGSLTAPAKDTYSEGEYFNPAGISFKVTKGSDSKEYTITSTTPGFMVYPDRPLTQSDTSVVVVYNNVAIPVSGITVTGRTLKTIAVTKTPTAAAFYVGQVFDPTGMVVTATYNNKTTSDVSSYTYPTTAFTDADIGTKEITLSYVEGTTTAKTALNVTITAAPIKVATVILNTQTVNTTASLQTQLKASVQPTNATNTGVAWSSSNTAVATVDQAGLVTGTGSGTCVITATATDGTGKYADCYVTVAAKIGVTKVTITASTNELLVAGTTTLAAAITPTTATQTVAVWKSSNEAVATVDANGLVTAIKLGNTNITATADGVTATLPFAVVSELSLWGTVVNCTRRVNVRAAASGTSTSIGYAYLNATYRVLGESGNWYKISYTAGNRTVGYIWKDYLTVSNILPSSGSSTGTTTGTDAGTSTGTGTGTGTTVTEGGTITVTTDVTGYSKLTVINCLRFVNVRKGASTSTAKVGYAKPGEVYTLLGRTGNWYIIDYKGATSYIYGQFGKLS